MKPSKPLILLVVPPGLEPEFPAWNIEGGNACFGMMRLCLV